MSLRSPLSPSFSRQGFKPLSNDNIDRSDDDNPNMGLYETDNGIPLASVNTRSSSTGARKPGEGALQDIQPMNPSDEKKALFSRGTGGGRRKAKRMQRAQRIGTDGEEVSVNGLGRFYNKIVNFSIVTRYLVYILPIGLLIAAPIIIYAIIKPRAIFFNTNMRTILFWSWIEIVWISIWISKLVSKCIPYVFMFLCGVVSSGTRKYAKVLRNVEIPLSLVGWSVTCLVTFTALTNSGLNENKTTLKWVTVMKNLLGPAVIASVLYLIEKMIVQLISINYHRRSFDGRIKEGKRSVHLLGLLYEASRTLFPMYCEEFIEEDYAINDSIEAMLAKTTGHKRSGSATPMRIIGNIGRVGDKVTSVFGNIASEITGKQVFNPTSAHSVVVEALEKKKSSEALAKRLWMSFVVEGKESLYQDDVEEVLGPARKVEAEEAFHALDQDGNGDISLDEMIMKVVEIGRDRKAISASMRDVGQAIGVLDSILVTVLTVIVIFIFVAFQDTNFVTTLATAGTTLLSLSFVFAATTQEFLGSCIFLFVKHPYDVGDRVDIVGPSQEFLIVEQISLLFTIFKRIDSMKMVQVPNIVLNNLWIENITRSKAMKEQLDMYISFDTSLEDIETLRREMEAFVRHPDNSRDFQSDITLEAVGIGNMDKMQLKVEIRHKSNWANESIRAARRSKFMCALVLALRKVPIYGPGGGGEPLGGATNPGYSVSVSDEIAAQARDHAAAAKEAKRLIPTPIKPDTSKSSGVDHLGSTAEEQAADMLSHRRPGPEDNAIWVGRDEDTLNSRDEELEIQRSNDLDDLKQGLLHRQSTRGRRRPGDHVPTIQRFDAPSMNITPSSPPPRRSMQRAETLDEEAELGLQQMVSGASYMGQGYAANQGSGFAMLPQRGQSTRVQGMGQPLGSAPTGSSGQSGRSRRLSLGFKGSKSAAGSSSEQ